MKRICLISKKEYGKLEDWDLKLLNLLYDLILI